MIRGLACICLFLSVALPAPAQVLVIANRSVPVRSLDSATLFDLYSGDIKVWANGQPVVLVDLSQNGETRDLFYKFLGKSPSRMKSIWMKNLLSGEGKPPESIETEDELVRTIAQTPGAIGYVSRSKATAADGDVVTLIVIGGEAAK
jgi:ABC-type phosphate transport system substrate-binding protein